MFNPPARSPGIGRSFGHVRAPAASSGVPGPSRGPELGGAHRDVPVDPEETRVRTDLPAPGDAPPGRVGVAETHSPMRSWTPRGAGDLPRQGRSREALRRRRVATRSQHAARVRREDPGRQVPCRVCRARTSGVAAQADARGRPRRRPRVQRPPRRGRGDRVPRAGGPPPPRTRGHREAARHLRYVRRRVAV